MGLSQEEHWSRLPFSSPGDLPHPGTESTSSTAPASTGEFFTTEPPGKPHVTRISPWSQNRGRRVETCDAAWAPSPCLVPGISSHKARLSGFLRHPEFSEHMFLFCLSPLSQGFVPAGERILVKSVQLLLGGVILCSRSAPKRPPYPQASLPDPS